MHAEIVRHEQALKADIIADEVDHHRRQRRAAVRVERGVGDMRGHRHRRQRRQRAEGFEIARQFGAAGGDDRQFEVAVGRGTAMAGDMLGHADRPRPAASRRAWRGRAPPPHRFGAEGAVADDVMAAGSPASSTGRQSTWMPRPREQRRQPPAHEPGGLDRGDRRLVVERGKGLPGGNCSGQSGASRATRPPSWSMRMGTSRPARSRKLAVRARTWSGLSTLRLNNM